MQHNLDPRSARSFLNRRSMGSFGMVPQWSPELLALDIGVLSFVPIYVVGLVFLVVRGARREIPGAVSIPQIFICGVVSTAASAIIFLVAAWALLGAT